MARSRPWCCWCDTGPPSGRWTRPSVFPELDMARGAPAGQGRGRGRVSQTSPVGRHNGAVSGRRRCWWCRCWRPQEAQPSREACPQAPPGRPGPPPGHPAAQGPPLGRPQPTHQSPGSWKILITGLHMGLVGLKCLWTLTGKITSHWTQITSRVIHRTTLSLVKKKIDQATRTFKYTLYHRGKTLNT